MIIQPGVDPGEGDVGYAEYASPHQPFSTMFWMNTIFP